MPTRFPSTLRLLITVLLLWSLPAASVPPARGETGDAPPLFSSIELRNLGPFRPGSWITALAVPEGDHPEHRYTFFVGARNGGVWKTGNLGTTFRNTTDAVGISAVGSLAVAPSHPLRVWVGTGDAENARSSYSGNGVWSSPDGGESWQHRGLERSHHVARIVVHPRRPERVWVAAMGPLFSDGGERGVFRTDDEGGSWRHVLDLGPRVGVIDLVIDPANPERLWAAAYDKQRLPWHFEAGGPGSGIYRSDDGGESWRRLEGGLPGGELGRIGLDVHRSDPRIVYAVIENLNPRPGRTPGMSDSGEKAEKEEEGQDPSEPEPFGNQVWRSDDGGDRWRQASPTDLSVGSKSAYAFNELRVDPLDPDKVYVISETLLSSVDGGRSWRDVEWPPKVLFAEMFGDVRSFWIDPRDPRRMVLGSDGGVFLSWDGGATTDWLANLPLGEVYAVAVDDADPYHVYAGLQDHEVWRGPVDSWSGAVTLEDWVVVGRWDGMMTQVSPDGRFAYTTTQFGNHLRADLDLGRWHEIAPRAPEGEPEYRFTWTTPIQLSPHDPDVLWTGSQKLLRSADRGDSWEERSPDLTTNDPVKIAGEGHIRYCTITSLSESPLRAGLLWVGTDDGRVWLSRDLGESWQERTDELAAAGAPVERWVSRVVPSRHVEGRVWVSKSGYRRDDFRPYLYRSDDFGATWTEVTDGLPEAPISAVVEDPRNPDLLFVGHDRGVHASLDGGRSWHPFGANLPVVPVRDLVIHRREADLVIGTYGRGVWVGDVHALQQSTPAVLASPVHLFEVEPRPVFLTERADWGDHELYGNRFLQVPNEPDGLAIDYWLGEPADGAVTITIRRPGVDEPLARLEGPAEAGLHRVRWLTREKAEDEEAPAVEIEPGEVEIVLEVGDHVHRRRSRLLEPPPMPVN